MLLRVETCAHHVLTGMQNMLLFFLSSRHEYEPFTSFVSFRKKYNYVLGNINSELSGL